MLFLIYFHLLTTINLVICITQPHIVVIIADDLGWNDVGHHGSSQIPTPNIDALAYNGVSFKKHYTLHICTPSRTALLTGKHPIRTGMQGYPISVGEPRFLPLNTPILSEKMSELGYSTHLVGKWHLGHNFRNTTPLGRGFKSHLGHWNGYCGYFDYEANDGSVTGYDLHRDYDPAYEYANTTFATDLYTEESINIIKNHKQTTPMFLVISHLAPHTGKNGLLEVKDENEANEKYNYIKSPGRRLYADLVNGLDVSVGRVVKALQETKMLENTIIVFMSDNGAQTYGYFENFGSNWPLRGLKFTLFEGGVRNTAFIWSTLLSKKKTVVNSVFHITDWFPTLYSAAGGNIQKLNNLDGVNQWPLLTKGILNQNRQFILLNIDEKSLHSGIITVDGRYKLTQGSYQNGIYDIHSGDSGRNPTDPPYNISAILTSDVNTAILKTFQTISPLTENDIIKLRFELQIEATEVNNTLTCKLQNGYCLFDLLNDPCETKDIQNENPEMFNKLKTALFKYTNEIVPQTNQPQDWLASNPKHCNGTWFTWGETDPKFKCANYISKPEEIKEKTSYTNITYVLLIVIFILTHIYTK